MRDLYIAFEHPFPIMHNQDQLGSYCDDVMENMIEDFNEKKMSEATDEIVSIYANTFHSNLSF